MIILVSSRIHSHLSHNYYALAAAYLTGVDTMDQLSMFFFVQNWEKVFNSNLVPGFAGVHCEHRLLTKLHHICQPEIYQCRVHYHEVPGIISIR